MDDITAFVGMVIARCGQQVRPRPLAETRQQQAERDELVCRRRQLVAHRTAAMNRRHRAAAATVRESLQAVLDHIHKELTRIGRELLALVESDGRPRGFRQTSSPLGGEDRFDASASNLVRGRREASAAAQARIAPSPRFFARAQNLPSIRIDEP
ncbi:MAG: hypothetical protein AB7U20_25855 [Planctomycetaceae bacterium]